MNKALDKIKKAWEDQPLQMIALASLAATAAAKLLRASNESRNSKTWKREVDRRRMKKMR